MYEYIKGELAELTPALAVIEAGGVGYFINISLHTYSALEGQAGMQTRLYIQFIVRDDAHLLYGFASRQEREIFRLLTGVSGVGVATARMILSTYAPAELSSIIATENAALLKNVKGLGLKTSQKIILELREKILGVTAGGAQDGYPVAAAGFSSDVTVSEALSALVMLGFPKSASEKTVRAIAAENPSAEVEEIIRQALKKL